jgi:RNA polymerase sigma-70 factor (ECF subfamily)
MGAARRAVAPTVRPDAAALLAWLPRLRRYARVLRRNPEDAEDLVQDTLERAWSRAGLWQGVGDMRTWLFSIMHNLHVDALRRGRLDTVDLDEQRIDVPAPATQGQALAQRDLDAALAALPVEQREVLLLVALDGLAYAEAARALGVPIGTVMSRLSRGRERLRGLIDGSSAAGVGGPQLLGGRGIAALPLRPPSVAVPPGPFHP